MPLGQRPPLRSPRRLAHIQGWFNACVPESVFSGGQWVSSFSTSNDIEGALSDVRQGDLRTWHA